MKKTLKVSFCLFMVLVLSGGTALGAGFKLPEQGAKAMGMSMAWTAQADDPSAIYYNPAGITQLEGQHILLGGTVILANGSGFTGNVIDPRFNTFAPIIGPGPAGALFPPLATAETGKDQTFFAPVAYYTIQTSEKVFLGIGLNAPFGLARTYDVNGNIALDVQHVKLETFVVNPTIAFKLNDFVSVGFGIDYMHAKAELDRRVAPIPSPPAPVAIPGTLFHLDGDGDDWTWNAGLLVTPGNFRFGFSFRDGYSVEIKGDATAFGDSSGGSTKVDMADIFNMAVAYQTDKFTIEFDYDYTNWSDFKNLDIRLDSSLAGILPTFLPQPKNWVDVAAYRLGFRYNFSESCYGSAGVFYDETPVPSSTLGSELPDSDRRGFSLGAGFEVKKIAVDLSYILFDYRDRHVDSPPSSKYDGTWTNEAHLFALNLGYKF